MSRAEFGHWMFVVVCLAIIPSCLSETFSYQQTDPPAELVCSNSLESANLTWKLNGTDITSRQNWDKEFSVFGNNTLRLLNVGPKTVGPYTCCDATTGNVIQSFDIKVLPYVTPFGKGKNVIEDDPLSLECKAWGVPEPVITWFRNGTQIVHDGSKTKLKTNTEGSGSAFPALENSTLRIEGVKSEEGGEYTCFATSDLNGDGKFVVANATVLVQVKDKYAALWPFLGICVEVAVLCTIILIYEKRRAKRIEEEERQEEAAHLNANNDTKAPLAGDDVRQRK